MAISPRNLSGHAHFYYTFFKVVKMNLTNLLRKNLPQLLDQSKRKLSPLSANKFPSDQMEDG